MEHGPRHPISPFALFARASGMALVALYAVACSGAVVDPPRPKAYGDAGVVTSGTLPLPTGTSTVPLPAGQCAPKQVTPQQVPWQPPRTPLHLNVCTPQEATAIVTCRFSQQNCNAQVSSACHACSVTGPNDPKSGPLIIGQDGSASVNIEGCVSALSGDVSANSCGARLLSASICESEACADCQTDQAFEACLGQADKTVCAQPVAAAKCADQYMASCVQGNSVAEIAFNLIKLFCGPQ